MGNEIARRVPAHSVATTDPVALGKVLAESGYFADARQAAQAAVKVMAGSEIGLPPVASMTGIHIVKGKVSIGYTLIAALIRRHPDYDYAVTEHTDEVCEVVIYYKGETAGTSRFTMADAKVAKLVPAPPDSPWNKYKRNMLFARAVSNAAKWYSSDVFAGNPIYTPDELGAVVDGETGEVLRLPPQDVSGGVDDATTGEETQDAFDVRAFHAQLKAEFGANPVKAEYTSRGIERLSDIDNLTADQIRMSLTAAQDALRASAINGDDEGLDSGISDEGLE